MANIRLGICSYIPEGRERKNALISIADGMFFAVMTGLTTPFWGPYLVKLGASDYTIALFASLPALVTVFSQIPAALIVDRYTDHLKPTVVWAVFNRVFLLIFALVTVLPIDPAAKPMLFVTLYSVRNFAGTACDTAWTSMVGEMFTPRLRGRFFGERNMLCTLATLLSTVAAGQLLDRAPWPWNYFTLYIVSFLALMASVYALTKHEVAPVKRSEDATSGVRTGLGSFAAAARDRTFVRFLVAVMAIHLGFHITTSLWTILWVKIMGLSNAWIGLFSTASGIASFLSYRTWGYWSEKYGNAKILAITGIAHIIVPVVCAHFQSAYVYVGLNAFGGFVGAGLNLALFNTLLDVSPSLGRPAYVATYNMGLNISAVLWPFVGVFMYGTLGMTTALDWCGVIRATGMIAAALLLLRGRSSEHTDVVETTVP